MTSNDSSHGERPGPIAYMASNGVAANLLMLAIIAAGLVSFTGIEREAWPTVPFFQIEVSMAYPGATPEEVEESIVLRIEDEVSGLDDVKAVKSVAAPGMASVRVEVSSGTDMAKALDDIESAVDRIQSFPAEADRPQIREMTNRQSMMRLIVHGAVSERSLKELAYQIKDEFTALPTVMIDFIDQKLGQGSSARTAIIEGAKGRFRPIMLTSLTTFLGFTPLILEDAVHAQFLVPFAASLGFGIAITTSLLMLLVPSLYTIHVRLTSRRRARGPALEAA